jgi:hypothetical protein
VAGFDLLRQARVAEQLGVAREHPEQRLPVIRLDDDRAAVLQLAQVALVVGVDARQGQSAGGGRQARHAPRGYRRPEMTAVAVTTSPSVPVVRG